MEVRRVDLEPDVQVQPDSCFDLFCKEVRKGEHTANSWDDEMKTSLLPRKNAPLLPLLAVPVSAKLSGSGFSV